MTTTTRLATNGQLSSVNQALDMRMYSRSPVVSDELRRMIFRISIRNFFMLWFRRRKTRTDLTITWQVNDDLLVRLKFRITDCSYQQVDHYSWRLINGVVQFFRSMIEIFEEKTTIIRKHEGFSCLITPWTCVQPRASVHMFVHVLIYISSVCLWFVF